MSRLNDHFGALCRFIAGGDAIVSWYTSLSNPTSNMYRVALTPDGSILMWLMGMAGMALVLDVVLNDLTPSFLRFGRKSYRIAWERAFRQRHWLFVLLAYCYGAQPYAGNNFELPLLVFFYWRSFVVLLIAFFDVRQRSRSPGWQRVHS